MVLCKIFLAHIQLHREPATKLSLTVIKHNISTNALMMLWKFCHSISSSNSKLTMLVISQSVLADSNFEHYTVFSVVELIICNTCLLFQMLFLPHLFLNLCLNLLPFRMLFQHSFSFSLSSFIYLAIKQRVGSIPYILSSARVLYACPQFSVCCSFFFL